MEALGRIFDVGVGHVPTDVVAGAITGKRVHLKNATGASFIYIATSGSTDIGDLDFQQHTVSSGGSPVDLDVVTHYYLKDATTLDNSNQWTKVTQSAASEVTDVGSASKQQIAVVEISAASLSDGYEWVSCDMPDAGSNGTKFCAGIWIVHGLNVQRAPANLAALLT
jgi:hypothetical protein